MISVLLEQKQPSDCQKRGTTIGTWKVCSLYICGKVQELTHELKCYRWDVLGLAEVRWTGFGETTTDEGHKIWYCGEDSKHQYGVVFNAWKEVEGSIINCTPIFSRLLSNQISAREQSHTEDSSPPESQRENKQKRQSFRSMHQPQTMNPSRSNSSVSSLIVS